jgi:hypothetical protein
MKVGDLVKIPPCIPYVQGPCDCFFCHYDSNRVGVVMEAPGLGVNEYYDWLVMFDCGEWEIYESDMARMRMAEVVSESR